MTAARHRLPSSFPLLKIVACLALLGMGSHFELWDAERYAAHEAEVMAQPMPDVLADFSF